MDKQLEVYNAPYHFLSRETPKETLPVQEMRLAITPASENNMEVSFASGNLFDMATATLGKYINASGTESNSVGTPNSKLNHSDYISVTAGNEYTVYAENGFTTGTQTCAFCWFDSSKQLLSRDTYVIQYNDANYQHTATAPASAAYLIINYCTKDQASVMLNDGHFAKPYQSFGTRTVKMETILYTGADLSVLFENWSEVPHTLFDDGSLIQCDGKLTEVEGTSDYMMQDTTYEEAITTEPADWETTWHLYVQNLRSTTLTTNGKTIPFPFSKATIGGFVNYGEHYWLPYFVSGIQKNDPENPAKRIMRIFTSENGGQYGISATGATMNTIYPNSYYRMNRVGGFAPTSSITGTPESNYPYCAMFCDSNFYGCYGSVISAGQYLGYIDRSPMIDTMYNQIFICVHFVKDDEDYYGYALMDMSSDDAGAVPTNMRIVAFSEDFWGSSVQPYVPPAPEDPSGPESTTGGGDGSWHWESDNTGSADGTAFIELFTDGLRVSHHNDIVQNGGINVYQINPQAVADVVGVLYGHDYFSKFENYMYNPLAAILSYHQIPQLFIQQMKSGGSDLFADLTAGGFNITNHMQTPQQFAVLESMVPVHIGSVNIENVFGAFIDFAPYTQITLHLPYIGDIEIDPNVCMYGELGVDYACDVMSGNVCAWVYVCDKDGAYHWLYQATGNCAFHVPLFSQTTDGSAVGKIVGGLIGIGAGIAGKNLKIGLEGGVALASGLVSLEGRQTHTSGTMAGNVSCLQDTDCYLHIQRPHWCNPANYQQLKGLPMEVSGTISSLELKGFIKTARIETDGITATEPEITEIERLLQTGVFYNP